MRVRLLLLGLLFLFGAFLLGSGMTGMVISQSCCTGTDCGGVEACSALQSPQAAESPLLGLLVSALASILVVGEMAWERHKRGQESLRQGRTWRVA